MNPAVGGKTAAAPAVGGMKRSQTPVPRNNKKSTTTSTALKKVGSDRKKSTASSDTSRLHAAKGGAKSGSGPVASKKKGGGIGLALKFTVPICVLIFSVIVVWGLSLKRSTQEMLINEIKKDGISGVMMLSEYGRSMVSAYRKSKQDEEWKNKVYWPVAEGFTTKAEFDKLLTEAGVKADEAPKASQFFDALSNAEILKNISYFKDSRGMLGPENEVLQAYIKESGNQGAFIAGSRKSTSAVIASQKFMDVAIDLKLVRIGKNIVDTSNYGITVYQATLTQGTQVNNVLVFQKSISGSGAEAILALSAEVIESEIGKLTSMMYLFGMIAMIAGAGICIGVAFWVTAPVKTLIRDMNIVAGGNLDHKTRAHSNDEIGRIANEFNEMTRKLLVARAAEKEAERLENELDMAREIQMKLLPPRVPQVTGFDIHAVYRPAKEVGGDYYDFLPIGIKDARTKDCLGIIVADVSGKGIPGSMVMATTRTILRFVASGNLSAADTLAKTNPIVAADIKRGM
ncbi:MAG: HAMP domain-containing protein, partial [Planctomycetes bacterium]|nr:HAMP domain-containing protein [Planctomycetota bacterium]